jgi:DNA-binding transcriptional regulator YdaS (Cro superfamily)
MENRDTYRRTLASAASIAGSDLALAVRLKTTPNQVKKWLAGVDPIPDAAFLDAVDIVVTAQVLGGPHTSS